MDYYVTLLRCEQEEREGGLGSGCYILDPALY